MATKKQNVAVVNSENVVESANITPNDLSLEQILEKLVTLDNESTKEKDDLISLFCVKAANVLINEKAVERLNKNYAKLYKLNDKKLVKTFEHVFTVLTSDWKKDKNSFATVPGTALVTFDKKLASCNNIDEFKNKWTFHQTAIKQYDTTLVAYASSVKIGTTEKVDSLDETKKKIAKSLLAQYKKSDEAGKKWLADIMRANSVAIPLC